MAARTAVTVGDGRPHVVMLVANDVRTDSRVRKSAVSLVRAGCRVTVVGYSPGSASTSVMAGVDILRVPVALPVRAPGREPAGPWLALGPRSEQRARATRQHLTRRRDEVLGWRRARVAGDRPVSSLLAHVVGGAGAGGLHLAGTAVRVARGVQRRVERRWVTSLERGSRQWSRAVPEALAYEHAFLPVVRALEPDAIHAHDVQLVRVADRAARLARAGAGVPWVYDAHELVAGLSLYGRRTAVERAGWLALETRYAPRATRMVTVSPGLADHLQARYRTPRPPEVVLNAPWDHGPAQASGSLRAELGVPDDATLLVYSGAVTAARGVHLAVGALGHLPGCHLAVMAVPAEAPYLDELRRRAEEAGAGQRLHVVPPVEPDAVVARLASADVALIPLLRYGSHDIALTNKLFEYVHAGLPVVVSDCPAQASFVQQHGIGTVHRADDPVDLARAVRDVLADIGRFRASVRRPSLRREHSWQESERRLVRLYSDVLATSLVLPSSTGFPCLVDVDAGARA